MTPTRILIGQIILVFAIVVGAVWSATQWAAGELGHQAALGGAWFKIADYPVYVPWRLFEWWYAYEAYAPGVFNRAGAVAASGGFLGVFVAIIGSLWRARRARRVTTYGSARWATEKEIRKSGLRKPRGVFLGRMGERYLRQDGPEHVMCFAPTRSGKGVGLVIPTLLSWTHSAVIHDIKGENWKLTAGWRSRFSHCLSFNPTDPASAGYNPLMEVRKGRHEVRDVQNIADILVDPEGVLETRNHWQSTSYALLIGAILHVLYAEKEKTLAGVAAFLSDPARPFEETLQAMMSANHLGTDAAPETHPVVAQIARGALNKAENERSGVLSTATTRLELYRDPTVAEVTSACDWRIADLMEAEQPVSLYLIVPPSDISRTKPLIRLILNQIGRRLTERLDGEASGGKRRKLLLMLDEFPALGRLDFFETSLSFMAGYGIKSFLIAQSLNQISKAYGENNSILDNCHVRVAFASNDERTAKRISDSLGMSTEQRAMRNYAGHRLAPWLAHVMVSRQETARPLLTPGEVMQLPADEELVMLAGRAPIRAKKLRYFEDANFASRVRPPPALAADGPYGDRPPSRADDWAGEARPCNASPANPPAAPDDDDDGGDSADGLHRHPELTEEPRKKREPENAPDAGLFDDETEPDDMQRKNERARNGNDIRTAHGVNRGAKRDGDDLIPDF